MPTPQKSIALLTCWYGPYPWYFPYFIHSCSFNPTVDFIIITDNKELGFNKPGNLHIVHKTLDELKKAAKEKLGFPVSIDYPYKLNDFKPAYAFLFTEIVKDYDFWASWCGPCRKSNPYLIQLHKKYHPLGLEIIGIAQDDNNQEAWKNAINHDGIAIWHHILQGFDLEKLKKGESNENDIGEMYGIYSLPTKILVGKNGIIIGRYEAGLEDKLALEKKLEEIFQ